MQVNRCDLTGPNHEYDIMNRLRVLRVNCRVADLRTAVCFMRRKSVDVN